MPEWLGNLLIGLAVIVAFGVLVGVFSWLEHIGYKDGYRDGQIDALSGKPAYELRLNERGETVWMEKAERDKEAPR